MSLKTRVFHFWTARTGTDRINTRRRFTVAAEDSEREALHKEIEEKANRLLNSELEKHVIELYGFGHVLDVGCGEHSSGEVGLDLNKNPKITVQGDAIALPFKENSFDTVVAHHSLEHIPKLGRALTELKRVMKSLAIIAVPTKEGSYVHAGHVWHLDREEWESLLKRGFEIEQSMIVANSYIFVCCKYPSPPL